MHASIVRQFANGHGESSCRFIKPQRHDQVYHEPIGRPRNIENRIFGRRLTFTCSRLLFALEMRVLGFVFVWIFFCGFVQAELVNGVNAIVNDAVITYDQVERGIAPIAEGLVRRYRSQPQVLEQQLQQLRTDQIEELVERQLILADFKSAGYNLPESFIDDAIQDEIRKNFYGDRAKLTKTLQAEGMTFEGFRRQQRERIIVDYLRGQHRSAEKVLISPYKIETYYAEHQEGFKVGDQVKLRMITINQPEGAAPGMAKKLADEVLKKIEEGTPFAEMAAVYSDGSQRAESGDRGWIERERTDMKKELVDAAFALKAGERSGVIEFPEACFLLHVEEVRAGHVRPLNEVRVEIEKTLKAQEGQRLEKKWIDRLKNKSFVRYF
ncbi:MAG: peptidylprolyl isomerase [Verrucomicrobiota bacterium]